MLLAELLLLCAWAAGCRITCPLGRWQPRIFPQRRPSSVDTGWPRSGSPRAAFHLLHWEPRAGGASSDFTHRVHAPCSSVHNERDTGPPARRRTCSHANTQCQRAGAWRYPRISTIAVVVPADRQASQQQYWVACAVTAAQAQGSIARLHGSKNAGAYRPSATASSPRSSLPRAVGQEGDARSKRVQAPSDTFA